MNTERDFYWFSENKFLAFSKWLKMCNNSLIEEFTRQESKVLGRKIFKWERISWFIDMKIAAQKLHKFVWTDSMLLHITMSWWYYAQCFVSGDQCKISPAQCNNYGDAFWWIFYNGYMFNLGNKSPLLKLEMQTRPCLVNLNVHSFRIPEDCGSEIGGWAAIVYS